MNRLANDKTNKINNEKKDFNSNDSKEKEINYNNDIHNKNNEN